MMATCVGGVPAAASAVVPASRREPLAMRGAARVAHNVGSRRAVGGVVVAARRKSVRARSAVAPRAAIADGPAAAASAAAKVAAAAAGKPKSRFSQADEFKQLVSEGHNLIPLYRRIFDDQLTPILAYRCLVKEDERDAPSFLLESVVGGTQTGRFSFLGSRPYMEVRSPPAPARPRASPRPRRPSLSVDPRLFPSPRSALTAPPLALPLHPPDRSSPRKVTSP